MMVGQKGHPPGARIYRSILDKSDLGYFEVDLQGNLTYFNHVLLRWSGLTFEELHGLNYKAFVHPDSIHEVFKSFHWVYLTGRPQKFFDWILVWQGMEQRVVKTSVDLIRGQDGEGVGFRGILQDITQQRRAEERVKQSEKLYRVIFEGSGTAMAILEPDLTIKMVNHRFRDLSGYNRKELEGRRNWMDLVAEEDRQRIEEYNRIRLGLQSGTAPQQYEFLFLDSNKHKRTVLATVSMVEDYTRVVSLMDLSQRKELEEELKYISQHDGLTGVLNRYSFERELSRLSHPNYKPLGLIICDLDDLKQINDTLGHSKGDEYIQRTANILCRNLRRRDVVARIGGDEFAILLPDSDDSEVRAVMLKLKNAVKENNREDPEKLIRISMGYSVSNSWDQDQERLFQLADWNMYRNKQQAKKEAEK